MRRLPVIANVTVYTRNSCPSCEGTKRLMDRLGIGYDVVNVEEDLVIAQQLVDEGWRAMPVVKTPTGSWAGMNADKIKELAW